MEKQICLALVAPHARYCIDFYIELYNVLKLHYNYKLIPW